MFPQLSLKLSGCARHDLDYKNTYKPCLLTSYLLSLQLMGTLTRIVLGCKDLLHAREILTKISYVLNVLTN